MMPSLRGALFATKQTRLRLYYLNKNVKTWVASSQTALLAMTALLLMTISTNIYALEENPYPFTSASQQTRFVALTKSIRCVVCQNQSIADSNAPLANDLRNKVYKMILDNQSDADIQDYLVKRYGEFILLQPRVNKLTMILWSFPFIALGIVFFIIKRVFSRRVL